MAEKVVFEGKLSGGSGETEKHSVAEIEASGNIAKSLINDFMLLVTIAGMKALFSKIPDAEEHINSLKKVWKERTSLQLAQETQSLQESIANAISETEKTDDPKNKENIEKLDNYMKSFCKTRDMAVNLADQAVNNIINTILSKDELFKKQS